MREVVKVRKTKTGKSGVKKEGWETDLLDLEVSWGVSWEEENSLVRKERRKGVRK